MKCKKHGNLGFVHSDEEKHSLPQAGGGNFTSWAKTTWATDRCSKQA
jgi:hypothetical protein